MSLDLKLIEQNRCPQIGCGKEYVRWGAGSDRGIHCSSCNYTVDINLYKEIMSEFIRKKFTNEVEPDEEELSEFNQN